jgi:sugar lactone lactonase YvrE
MMLGSRGRPHHVRSLRCHAVLTLAATAVMAGINATASAQNWSGIAVVDSASAARAAWVRAGTALRAGDIAESRRQIARAASAWPTQPSYLWASAILALRANDSGAVLDGLSRYAALGLGRDVAADTGLARLTGLPAFAAVRMAHEANFRPLVRSHPKLTFGDTTFWAEGVDADPATHHFYVASIRHRTIADVAPDGRSRELWPRDQPALGAMFGVRVDAARGLLWATTSGVPQTEGYLPADSSIAALLQIRPSDGAILRRWDLPPVTGGHVLGDLAVGPRGDVYLTDSNQPVLYRLRPGADTLESITSPFFHSLQGMAPTPDGRLLYVADYSHGLLRVELRSGVVTRLADAPNSTSLGCDGIVWYRGTIIAVQNGVAPARIVRFTLDASGTRIERLDVLDRNAQVADEPTIGTILGNEFVYVANGQWEKFGDKGERLPGVPLGRTVLLAVPLPR